MMGPQGEAVLEAALGLPEAERALIAERLLATLPPGEEGPAGDEFEAELDRRWDEARDDPSATVSWAELKDE